MLRRLFIAAVVLGSLVHVLSTMRPVAGAEIEIVFIDEGRGARIRLSGEITSAMIKDVGDLIDAVRNEYETVIFELDSPGGDVMAAIEIGRLFRANSVMTIVRDDDGSRCLSACVFVLAGGVSRFADGGTVGVHRPRFEATYFAGLSEPAARARYDTLTADVAGYLAEMEISVDLFKIMMRVPSKDIRMLTFEELNDTALDGTDPAHEEWLRAKLVAQCGPERAAEIERQDRASSEFFQNCVARTGQLESCAEETDRVFEDLLGPGC